MKRKPGTSVRSNIGQFCVAPLWLAEAVSGRALQLFVILAAKYADRETEEASVSRQGLAKALSCSTASIDRSLEELVSVGALEIESQFGRGGHQVENCYRLIYSKPVPKRAKSDDPTLITGDDPTLISPLITSDDPSYQEYQEGSDALFAFPRSAKTQERPMDDPSLHLPSDVSASSDHAGEKFSPAAGGNEFPEPDDFVAEPRLRLLASRFCDACGDGFSAAEGETICPDCMSAYVAMSRERATS